MDPILAKELVAQAVEFRRLAAWEFLYDSELLGLHDEGAGAVRLGSILGQMGQVFGLAVYHGKVGVGWILRTLARDASEGLPDLEEAYEQECWKLEFVTEVELGEEDRQLLTAAGFQPVPEEDPEVPLWPQFRSFLPGYVPWILSEPEAAQFVADLARINAFLRMVAEDLSLLDHEDNAIPFLPATDAPLIPASVQWHELRVPPKPEPTLPDVEPEVLEALRQLPTATHIVLEVDERWFPSAMQAEPRPFFPLLFAVVDGRAGTALAMDVADSRAGGKEELLHIAFLAFLKRVGCLPGQVRVFREELAAVLEPLGEELGFLVSRREELPLLEEAVASLLDSLKQSDPRSNSLPE